MHCAWDAAKASDNLHKHGISFAEAETAFDDEEALTLPDPDHSLAEDRFVLLGLSSTLRLLAVAHSFGIDTEEIRIISARRATRSERAHYGAWRMR